MGSILRRFTKLELGLYVWGVVNATFVLFLLLGLSLGILTPRAASILGRPLSAQLWLLFAPSLITAAILYYFLLRPTPLLLFLAALYWLMQAVTIHLADGFFYGIRLGFALNFRVTDNPDFLVTINLVAVLCSALCVIAAVRRGKAAPSSQAPHAPSA